MSVPFDTNLTMDRAAEKIEKAKEELKNRRPTEALTALWGAELFYQLGGVKLESGNAYHDHLQFLQEDVKKQMKPNYTLDQF